MRAKFRVGQYQNYGKIDISICNICNGGYECISICHCDEIRVYYGDSHHDHTIMLMNFNESEPITTFYDVSDIDVDLTQHHFIHENLRIRLTPKYHNGYFEYKIERVKL